VLQLNFQKHSGGAERIREGLFAIQDSATKKDVDLTNDWELCFMLGQRVDMSMVVHDSASSMWRGDRCPRCKKSNSTEKVENLLDID
jgi:hypothetical protein